MHKSSCYYIKQSYRDVFKDLESNGPIRLYKILHCVPKTKLFTNNIDLELGFRTEGRGRDEVRTVLCLFYEKPDKRFRGSIFLILMILDSHVLKIALVSRVNFCKYLRNYMLSTISKTFGGANFETKQRMPVFSTKSLEFASKTKVKVVQYSSKFSTEAEHVQAIYSRLLANRISVVLYSVLVYCIKNKAVPLKESNLLVDNKNVRVG